MKHRTRKTEKPTLASASAPNSAECRDDKRRSDLIVVMPPAKIELPTLGPGATAVRGEQLLHRAVSCINTYFQLTGSVRTSEIGAAEADNRLLLAERFVVQALDCLEVASAGLVGEERIEELRNRPL